MSSLFAWLGANQLVAGLGTGIIVALIGVVWALSKKPSPGLEVADEYMKSQLKENIDEAKRKKEEADRLIAGTGDGSGSDISESDAVGVITGAIKDGEGRQGPR